jgi:hypothetical protein
MSGKTLMRHLKRNVILTAGLVIAAPAAMASTQWIGSADYKLAPGAAGDEGPAIGPFDSYDFAPGAAMIKFTPDSATTGTVEGWYQSYVRSHDLGFIGVSNGSLGSTYELTAVAHFFGSYSNSIDGNTQSVDNMTGDVALYFDTTPDHSFISDTGFSDVDTQRILWGNINSGNGSLFKGTGGQELTLNFVGAASGSDPAVYSPSTIGGADAFFSITTKGLQSVNFSSVQGHADGQKFVSDGYMQLTAVPVPAAVWLFGTGLLGLISTGKGKRIAG